MQNNIKCEESPSFYKEIRKCLVILYTGSFFWDFLMFTRVSAIKSVRNVFPVNCTNYNTRHNNFIRFRVCYVFTTFIYEFT